MAKVAINNPPPAPFSRDIIVGIDLHDHPLVAYVHPAETRQPAAINDLGRGAFWCLSVVHFFRLTAAGRCGR
jgi:molecular chaperone HscA